MSTVRVFPFSIFDPVHLGLDEYGEQVHVNLAERNMLLGGEPGAGKSSAINLIAAHGALSADCKLILIDGKQVELGPWHRCADQFIGPSINAATDAFEDFQAKMNARYDKLLAQGAPQDHPRIRRTRLPDPDRRIRLLLRHRRHQARTGEVRRPHPRPGRPRPRRRGHRHPRHPAPLPPGHRPIHAGPVLLPVGVPLHHRLLFRHRARARLGIGGLHRRRHRPPRPRRRLAARRIRRPHGGSKPPTSPTPTSPTWPPTPPASAATQHAA